MARHAVTHYTVRSEKIREPLTLAVAADLHNGQCEDVMEEICASDAILICGDLVNRHRHSHENAEAFLKQAVLAAPTFFCLGNHERKYENREAFLAFARGSGAHVLEKTWMPFRGIAIGAVNSISALDMTEPDTHMLRDMQSFNGFRLVLCHHPEYYERWVKPYGMELTISGHAHGGQIALFGQGLFAPGQGLFPRLTHGFYDDGHLLVSRGMTNCSLPPRIGTPEELVLLRLEPVSNTKA